MTDDAPPHDPHAPAAPGPEVTAPTSDAAPPPAAPAVPAAPVPEPAPAPAQEPAPPPDVPAPAPRRRLRAAAFAALALGLLLFLGPWLLSATVLTPLVRGGLGRGGQPGELGRAEVSWTRGLRLAGLSIPAGREGAGPRVLLDGVTVDVSLARAAVAAATGGTLPVRVVVGRGRIELDLPADAGEPTTPGPAPAPEPTPEPTPPGEPSGAPATLPCAVTAEVVVEGLDVAISVSDPGAPPVRLEVRGLVVTGGAALARSAALDMPQGLRTSIEALRLEAPGLLEGPLVVEGGALEVRRLSLAPPGAAPPLERVALEARLSAPRAEFEGTPLRNLVLDITLVDGKLDLAVTAATQGGRLDLRASTRPTDLRRIPVDLDLALTDIQVGGPTARALPYLVPLLHATTVPAGGAPVVGLPPVSIRGEGRLDLITGDDGAPLLDDSLRTLAGKGEFTLGRGSFAASRAIDGYARALLGLGVASYLDGLLPPGLRFGGAAGRFEVAAGLVTLPGIDLKSEAVDLRISGQASFDGPYRLNVRTLDAAGGAAVKQVLQVIDDAGGVTIEGDLVQGTCAPALPDAAKLEAAGRSAGLPDVLRRLAR